MVYALYVVAVCSTTILQARELQDLGRLPNSMNCFAPGVLVMFMSCLHSQSTQVSGFTGPWKVDLCFWDIGKDGHNYIYIYMHMHT